MNVSLMFIFSGNFQFETGLLFTQAGPDMFFMV